MKKGGTHIDWVVGLIFFLGFVTITFYYMAYIAYPKFPFERALKLEGMRIADAVVDETEWSVYRTPVLVTFSNTTVDWPFELYFQLSELTDLNSIVVLDENKSEIYSEFNSTENKIMFVSNITGNMRFYAVRTENTTLSPRSYTTDLSRNGLQVNNSKINVSFSDSGVDSLQFNGSEFLSASGIIIGTSSTPSISNGTIRAKVQYPEGNVVKVYANNSRIFFSSNSTYDAGLQLSTAFTNFYNGSAETFSSLGQVYQGTRDFIDVYSGNGITIISEDTVFTVSNFAGYRQINLSSASDFEIYLHSGDYNAGIKENTTYLNPPTALYSMTDKIRGVSQDKIDELMAEEQTALENRLGIKDMGFNISFDDTLG